MKTKVFWIAAVASICLIAADKIQPINAKLGLWEITTTQQMHGSGGAPAIPADKLAQMPPEQRAQIEAMIKQRTGGSPTTRTRQTCITQEKLDKGPFSEDRKSCERTIVSSSSKLLEIHEVCAETDGSQRTADVKYEIQSDGAMKGSMVVKANTAGRAMTMNMDVTGKWVGADCGAVK